MGKQLMHLERHRLAREAREFAMRAELEKFNCSCGKVLEARLVPDEPKRVRCAKCGKVYMVRVEISKAA